MASDERRGADALMSENGRLDFCLDDLPLDELPAMTPFFESSARKSLEGLPTIEGQFVGSWDDTEQSIKIRSTGNVRRGGNQYQCWWTFDAEATGPDGEVLPTKRVRVAVPRVP